jgi:O-antigen/teichoic acid export membrane protein
MGSSWLETLLRGFYVVVIARYLGAEMYGQWAYGISAYGLVIGLVGFGFDTLIAIRLGADKQGADRFIGLTLVLRLLLLGLATVVFAGYAITIEPDPNVRMVFFALVPALVGRGIAIWARSCFLGYEQMSAYIKIASLIRIAEAGCGTVYLVTGGDLLGVVLIHSVFWVVEGAFGLWRVRTHLSRYVLWFNWQQATAFLAKGTVLGLSAGMFTWLVLGPLIILRNVGESMSQLAQFAIVSNLTMMLVGSIMAFFGAALPVLSRAVERKDKRVSTFGPTIVIVVVFASTIVSGFGLLLGPPLIEWALGPDYIPAGKMVGYFLFIGGLVLAPAGYAQILQISSQFWPGAIANISGGIALLISIPPSVSRWGVMGAVFATGGAWLIRAIVIIFLALKHRSIEQKADSSLANPALSLSVLKSFWREDLSKALPGVSNKNSENSRDSGP